MSLKKLELQNIEHFEIEKKKDESSAVVSVFGEVCELRFYQGVYTFKKRVTTIGEIDADIITRLCKCLSAINGGLSAVHSRLSIVDETLYSVIAIDVDEITNVKIHDRIINFFGVTQYLNEVFTSHSI